MPITSAIINTKNKNARAIVPLLEKIPSVEIYNIFQNRMIITVESQTAKKELDILNNLRNIPNIQSIHVVFTSLEDCCSGVDQ